MRLTRTAAFALVTGLVACQSMTDTPVSPVNVSSAALTAAASDDRWIVTLHDSVRDVRAVSRQLAAGLGAVPSHVYVHALPGFAVTLPGSAAQGLARMPQVKRVEADLVMNAFATQSGVTWGIDRLDQRASALSGTYTYNNEGAGVAAYILDTGIRYDHTEFQTSSTNVTSRASLGFDAMADSATYRGADCHGHGTHVAGTVGGLVYGVAKQVRLYSLRVLGCTGSGATSGILAAIDWMIQHHQPGAPAVANMSLGGGFNQSLNDGVKRAVQDGIVMAVAAGNSNADACTFSPASEPTAITLGASGMTDARASFSNYGTCLDLFAPGVSIVSAGYGSTTATATFSGTSMASPHAAGAAALYLVGFPGSTPQQVRDGLVGMSTQGVVTGAGSPNNHLLYTLSIGSAGSPPANVAPVAGFLYSCTALSCTFTNQSTDSDGTIVTHAWNFGDGSSAATANASRTFAAAGTYQVSLTVTDDDGAPSSITKAVTVSSAPAPAPTPVNITLSASKRVQGTYKVDLGWQGATGSFDVYRNGRRVITLTGLAYTDNVGKKAGTYTHKVCLAGTTTCSNETTTTF